MPDSSLDDPCGTARACRRGSTRVGRSSSLRSSAASSSARPRSSSQMSRRSDRADGDGEPASIRRQARERVVARLGEKDAALPSRTDGSRSATTARAVLIEQRAVAAQRDACHSGGRVDRDVARRAARAFPMSFAASHVDAHAHDRAVQPRRTSARRRRCRAAARRGRRTWSARPSRATRSPCCDVLSALLVVLAYRTIPRRRGRTEHPDRTSPWARSGLPNWSRRHRPDLGDRVYCRRCPRRR